MSRREHVAIVGAGLVGSLLGVLLRKRGFEVSIFEKRGDLRDIQVKNGRSINLALSDRGIRALRESGIYEDLKTELVPMNGRLMHSRGGELTFQPYGKEGQHINSVSRLNLNRKLIDIGERAGISYYFDHRCVDVNPRRTTVYFGYEGGEIKREVDVIIGADGAFSEVRKCILEEEKQNFTKEFLDYGYKELSIPPGSDGDFQFEPNYLHIWPREQYMLIALPNPDKSFTCTLFLPYEGEVSFESLKSNQDVLDFFAKHFPDAQGRMPHLLEEFNRNPVSSLVTIHSYPWHSHRTLVIGDASHAIVPFYGQGMNAGFEDCRILMEIADAYAYDWETVFKVFEQSRKPDADAIASLALSNFIEMREKVRDEGFLERKKIEALLHEQYPNDWIPLYTMVTFSHIPYSEAKRLGQLQDQVFRKARAEGYTDDLPRMVAEFNALKKGAETVPQ
ncbi:MAG: NAD(P)/FAD-dependent oxidoreductase [Bacteroidota bacterium]